MRQRLVWLGIADMIPAPDYEVGSARLKDVPFLPSVERAAATLLRGHAPNFVLEETTSEAEFHVAQRNGLLWVVRMNDVPVGFAHAEILEPAVAHLKELDVHPEHVRRGLGSRLVMAVCTWAAATNYHSLTLTTFRDVPFNMPFYARLGFEVIPQAELSSALRSVILEEARRGLDPARRVAMRRRFADGGTAMPNDASLSQNCRDKHELWTTSKLVVNTRGETAQPQNALSGPHDLFRQVSLASSNSEVDRKIRIVTLFQQSQNKESL